MALKPGLRAGLWTLVERIGRGGMAEVWRGTADDSPDVAIKLMPQARTEERAFETEASALARLVHPRIIRILDFGVMTDDDGELPFLALELARGPSLDRWLAVTPVGWNHVLDVARRVLEALAHAHARGLVHRDIKPANILAMDAAGTDWRLTDFGIARADDVITEQHNPSGTPPYMAPEQFLGRSRDQGPWTDLYSLGCVLFEMLTGRPPFVGEGMVNLAFQHIREAPPVLEARVDVPDGLDELVGVLLRKDPLARFRSAADALRALEKLPRLRTSRPITALGGFGADTQVTPGFEPTLILGDLKGFDWRPEGDGEAPVVEPGSPPLEPPATSPRHYFSTFHGDTGPGLTSLRELPYIGRLEERTAIWSVFRDVVEHRERRTVVVSGPQGIGKTAIGRWLTQAVVELGLATVIRVDGAQDAERALTAAVSAAYRLEPYDLALTTARLRRWATPPDWAVETLARGVCSTAGPGEDVVGAALAMLWAHAERRPVVIWIDDADDAGRAALVERVASLPFASVPVLVIAMARDSSATLRAAADEQVVIGAFPPGECADLITELVGITAAEAFRVASAVGGNPQFAVEVVRDWIARGQLVRTAGRWTLRGGRLPELPGSVGAVRLQLFEALVEGEIADRRAMELLACYGAECPHREWVLACAAAGISPSRGLIVRAMRAGLVTQHDEVLQYADGVLRRRLLESARASGRGVAFHRAIVEVIRRDPGRHPPGLVGTHLMEAGDFAEALEPLLRAMQATQRWDQIELEELLDRYDTAIAAVGAGDALQGWWGRFTRARLLASHWKSTEAAEALASVIDAAHSRGWVELECDATIAYTNLVAARAPEGRDGEIAARGIGLADTLGDDLRRARTRCAAGAMFGYLGQLDEAQRYYAEAHALAVELDDPTEEADANYGIGWVYFLQGKLDRALEPLHLAIDAMESVGRIRAAQAVRSFTGDVLRALGRLDEAEAAFTQAYHYFSRYHVLEAVMPANFAILEVARGRTDDALRWARRAREIETTRGRVPILALADAVEVLHAAEQQDEAAWDIAFSALRAIHAGEDANYDVAYVTDIAARETAGRLDRDRTQAVIELAIGLWVRLGRQAEADALRLLL